MEDLATMFWWCLAAIVADLETRFLYCLVAIDADLETYLVCDEDFDVSINDCTRLGDRAFVGASGAPPCGVVF